MMRALAMLLVLGVSGSSATAWRSTLYPTNWQPPAAESANFETGKVIQDFSYAGYHAGETPIPDVPGPIYDATQAPFNADATGTTDSTAAIQGAIDAAEAAGGGVVWLPAGLYKVSPQSGAAYALRIDNSGVVLRGAGTGQTFLLNTATNMRSKSVIRIEGPATAGFYYDSAVIRTITTNLMGPTKVIPLGDTTGLVPGQYVVVRADCTDAWATEHNEQEWVGYGSSLRGTAYFRRLTAVDAAAGTITIDTPTRYYLKTRDNARVVRLGGAGPVTVVGLEDFSIGNVQHPGSGWAEEDYHYSTNACYDAHDSFLIRIIRGRDCWIRRVHSFQASENTTTCHLLSNGVLLNESSRITVADLHLQRPQFGGGGGNGYMYRLNHANDCLIQNCRATHSRHGFVLSLMSSAGNVFHRCVDSITGKQTGDTGSQETLGRSSDHHMHFSHSNLIDTSTGDSSWWDAVYRPYGGPPDHNLVSAHGVYWNMLGTGTGPDYVVRTEQSRYGYAIGTRGLRPGVERPSAGGDKCNPPDHVEGMGLGDTLEPFSLYEDQLARRLQLSEVLLPNGVVLPFPSNSVYVTASVQVGRQPVPPGAYNLQWRAAAGSGTVRFSNPTNADTFVSFSTRRPHDIEVIATLDGQTLTNCLTVTLAPDITAYSQSHLPLADAYVRDGAYAGDNYGTYNGLWMKKDAPGSGYNRVFFLQFNLAGTVIQPNTDVVLHLRSYSAFDPDEAGTGEMRFVPDNAWSEAGVRWSNQPAMSDLICTWQTATTGVDDIALPVSALADKAANGLLSLGVRVASQPGYRVYQYYSKESAGPESQPRLTVDSDFAAPEFSDWIAGYAAIPPAQRDPADDADQDGLSNAEEYFFGRDPSVADTAPVWTFQNEEQGWSLRFPQRVFLPALLI